MMSQEELAREHASTTAVSLTPLTAEELRRLEAYQRRCDYQPVCVELGLDPRRLEFARWLVQRGALNEGVIEELEQG